MRLRQGTERPHPFVHKGAFLVLCKLAHRLINITSFYQKDKMNILDSYFDNAAFE